MSRRAWVAAAIVAAVVVVAVAMIGTDLKYAVADLCRAMTGDARSCYEAIAKPLEFT